MSDKGYMCWFDLQNVIVFRLYSSFWFFVYFEDFFMYSFDFDVEDDYIYLELSEFEMVESGMVYKMNIDGFDESECEMLIGQDLDKLERFKYGELFRIL